MPAMPPAWARNWPDSGPKGVIGLCVSLWMELGPTEPQAAGDHLRNGSVEHLVDEQDRNADRKAKEIDSHDLGDAVFLEAIAASYYDSE
jgi:hypothetical protein